jgi:hypothetical protein
VREGHLVQDLQAGSAADGGERGQEIAEAIHGEASGLFEGRAVEGGRRVGAVVLHVVGGAGERPAPERAQPRGQVGHVAQVRQAVLDRGQPRPAAEREERLVQQVRPRVPGDGDVGDAREVGAGLVQDGSDGAGGEAGPVLDAVEPLLLHAGQEMAVAHQDRGRVAVEGVDAEDVHRSGGQALALEPVAEHRQGPGPRPG